MEEGVPHLQVGHVVHQALGEGENVEDIIDLDEVVESELDQLEILESRVEVEVVAPLLLELIVDVLQNQAEALDYLSQAQQLFLVKVPNNLYFVNPMEIFEDEGDVGDILGDVVLEGLGGLVVELDLDELGENSDELLLQVALPVNHGA